MKSLAIVACGGAVGAAARYLIHLLAVRCLGSHFPFGTLIVNVAGCFAMGLAMEAMGLVWSASVEARLFLLVGVLGAFTTFSTFSLDFATLYRNEQLGLSALYVLVSVACSIGALFGGLALARLALAEG